MDRGRTFKLIAAIGFALSLQGCVAAAFPVVAGGLMARGSGSDAKQEGASPASVAQTQPVEATETAPVEPAPDTTGIVEVAPSTQFEESFGTASDNGTFIEAEADSVAITPETQSPAPTALAVTEATQAQAQLPTEASTDVALPAVAELGTGPSELSTDASESSSIVMPIPDAVPAVAGGTFFDPLFAYASALEVSETGTRPSAMLLDAAALRPERVACETGEPTVLIDLDPETGELFPIDARSASPALAERLADLRVRGVLIAWISHRFANRENEVRRALLQSGLDPLGTDEVLLMRTSDERKQTRRDELARKSCLVAIAGDTRADFHELFDYLLNPGDAAALEPLIGEGWFLIPTPLLAERTRP